MNNQQNNAQIQYEYYTEPPKEKKKTPFIIIIAVLLAVIAALIAFIIINNSDGGSKDKNVTSTEVENVNAGIKSVNVGDYITFGTYEQDNNTSNGKEDIEWLVLANNLWKGKHRILVISRFALDCQIFDSEVYKSVKWEKDRKSVV